MTESASKHLSLNPSQAAGPAIARGLQQLFEIMEDNEKGVIERFDPELLHDFRIAVRRTRTVLSQFNAVFPEKTKAFEDTLSWLGELTGPARDYDVLILEIEKLRKLRLKKLHDTLPVLKRYLQHKQDDLYKPLIDALQSQNYRRFKTNWQEFLKKCMDQPAQADTSADRIGHVAPRKIWKRYTCILRQGARINPGSPASDYHQLRKACKKLRYLMEYFQSLYAGKDIRPLIKELKKFQDNLGEHQDLEVHIANLTTCGQEIQTQSDVSAGLPDTIERICRRFEKRKLQLRKQFLTRFDEFSRKANRKRFRALFHHE
jgi:CHAD domain-containing protein